MDLERVRGIDKDAAEAIRGAGVLNTAELARVTDAADLARATRMEVERMRELIAAAQDRVVTLLKDAGFGDESALAAAPPGEIAARSGIPQRDVEWFQAAAREALGVDGPHRVLLTEGVATARVQIGSKFSDVPIVTAKAGDDADRVLSAAPSDAVLLQEGATLARARLGGKSLEALPIFKTKPDGSEVRVRVAAIEVGGAGTPPKEKSSFLSRFKKRS